MWTTGQWEVQAELGLSSRAYSQTVRNDTDYYYRIIAVRGSETRVSNQVFECSALPMPAPVPAPTPTPAPPLPPAPTPTPAPEPTPTPPPPPPPPAAPTLTFTVSPSTITVGQAASLSWTSTGVTGCAASGGWTGSRPIDGSESVTPLTIGQVIYTLTCTGLANQVAQSVSLTVNAVPPPPPQVRTIELTPSGASGAVNATLQTGVTCRINGAPVSCSPWWYSSDPSRVSVNGATGLVRYIFRGSATICVQWSLTETEPKACHLFTTQ